MIVYEARCILGLYNIKHVHTWHNHLRVIRAFWVLALLEAEVPGVQVAWTYMFASGERTPK